MLKDPTVLFIQPVRVSGSPCRFVRFEIDNQEASVSIGETTILRLDEYFGPCKVKATASLTEALGSGIPFETTLEELFSNQRRINNSLSIKVSRAPFKSTPPSFTILKESSNAEFPKRCDFCDNWFTSAPIYHQHLSSSHAGLASSSGSRIQSTNSISTVSGSLSPIQPEYLGSYRSYAKEEEEEEEVKTRKPLSHPNIVEICLSSIDQRRCLPAPRANLTIRYFLLTGTCLNLLFSDKKFNYLHVATLIGIPHILSSILDLAEMCDCKLNLLKHVNSDGLRALDLSLLVASQATNTLLDSYSQMNCIADTNEKNRILHFAVVGGSASIVSLLMSDRYNLRTYLQEEDESGKTPFSLACTMPNVDVVSTLIQIVLDSRQGNSVDASVANEISTEGQLQLISMILRRGADGNTPLMLSLIHKNFGIASLLFHSFTSSLLQLKAFNNDGENALILTARVGHYLLFKDLIRLPNMSLYRWVDGKTILHLSIQGQFDDISNEILNLISTRSCDLSVDFVLIKDMSGKTAIDYTVVGSDMFNKIKQLFPDESSDLPPILVLGRQESMESTLSVDHALPAVSLDAFVESKTHENNSEGKTMNIMSKGTKCADSAFIQNYLVSIVRQVSLMLGFSPEVTLSLLITAKFKIDDVTLRFLDNDFEIAMDGYFPLNIPRSDMLVSVIKPNKFHEDLQCVNRSKNIPMKSHHYSSAIKKRACEVASLFSIPDHYEAPLNRVNEDRDSKLEVFDEDKTETPVNAQEDVSCCVCLCQLEGPSLSSSYQFICGHHYCLECIMLKAQADLNSLGPRVVNECKCAACSCPMLLSFWLQTNDAAFGRYIDYLILYFSNHYKNQRMLKCPADACTNVFILTDSDSLECHCRCGREFCAACLRSPHAPLTCKEAEAWHSLDSRQSVVASMIHLMKNYKRCPKCKAFIEKNEGCNHMTCRTTAGGCGHEFCWVCSRDYPCSVGCTTLTSQEWNLKQTDEMKSIMPLSLTSISSESKNDDSKIWSKWGEASERILKYTKREARVSSSKQIIKQRMRDAMTSDIKASCAKLEKLLDKSIFLLNVLRAIEVRLFFLHSGLSSIADSSTGTDNDNDGPSSISFSSIFRKAMRSLRASSSQPTMEGFISRFTVVRDTLLQLTDDVLKLLGDEVIVAGKGSIDLEGAESLCDLLCEYCRNMTDSIENDEAVSPFQIRSVNSEPDVDNSEFQKAVAMRARDE